MKPSKRFITLSAIILNTIPFFFAEISPVFAGSTFHLLGVEFAQAEETCPNNAGGGKRIALYTTDSYYIYICQGGTGREDWRELDYYAIPTNRQYGDEWIRLRAYIGQTGYYAINGSIRYEINGSFLKVIDNGKTIFQESVFACTGNPVACEKP